MCNCAGGQLLDWWLLMKTKYYIVVGKIRPRTPTARGSSTNSGIIQHLRDTTWANFSNGLYSRLSLIVFN
jgi:hypothetical protein